MSVGDLVVIDSEAEWKFVLEALKSKGEEDELWMGASASKGWRGFGCKLGEGYGRDGFECGFGMDGDGVGSSQDQRV